MPALDINGFQLNYEVHGEGDLVVLSMGMGARGNVWTLHQVPFLVEAGYRVATYDARGISPVPGQTERDCPPITLEELVGDLASLIEHLGGPAYVVGTSLGALTVQELALARPDLVKRAVAMAAHARLDRTQQVCTRGEQELFDRGIELPPAYQAALTAIFNLSPATLRDDVKVKDWLDMFELTAGPISSGERAQLAVSARTGDRREAYAAISTPLLAVGYADDATLPPYLAREVAEAAPNGQYAEVPDAGHFGYLEQPDIVNRLILDFLTDGPTP